MPLLSLGSMGAGGLPSPYLLDVAMSPGGGLMTLPLPDSLPHSTPDMLTAALQHAGLGGLMDPQSKGGNQMVSLQVSAAYTQACPAFLYVEPGHALRCADVQCISSDVATCLA